MPRRYPSLTPDDLAKLVGSLDEAMAVFRTNRRVLSVFEIKAKSMLSAVRDEIHQERLTADAGSEPPTTRGR